MQTVQIIIHGRVQGVWFRKNTLDTAIRLGVKGTVRNLEDGGVEVYVSGSQESLKQFIDWCKNGPELAEVKKIVVRELEYLEFSDFKIVP